MKRSKPLRAKKALQVDPEKVKAWQDRSRSELKRSTLASSSSGLARASSGSAGSTAARSSVSRSRTRRNDSGWRAECLAVRGSSCRACGSTGPVQMDHLIPRSQRGPSVVENGLPLCDPWASGSSFPEGCHQAKTDHKLLIRPEWLDADQIAWLAEKGYARWCPDTGEVSGEHWKIFDNARPKLAG